MIRYFRFALVMLILVIVALTSALITMHFAIHGAEVTVPNFKGMSVLEAQRQSSGLGLNLNVENRYYSSEIPAGSILSQSPKAGTVVRREWNVRIAESLGPQKVSIPNVVGLPERAATLQLRKAGLELNTSARIPFPGVPPGIVIAQDPPANGKDVERPSVSLLVAGVPLEETANGFIMPDYTGESSSIAMAELMQRGFKVDAPRLVDAPIPPVGQGNAPIQPPKIAGTVLAQVPAAGSLLTMDTMVQFTVVR